MSKEKPKKIYCYMDESEPIIRLADMWAGCVRAAISNGRDEKVILDRAEKEKYAHDVTKTKNPLKERDIKISRLAKLSFGQSLPKGQAFAEIFNSIVANYLSLSIVIHTKKLRV